MGQSTTGSRGPQLTARGAEILCLAILGASSDPTRARARLSALIASRLSRTACRYREQGDLVKAVETLELAEAALLRARAGSEAARA